MGKDFPGLLALFPALQCKSQIRDRDLLLFTVHSCPPTSAYYHSLAAGIARQEKTNGKLHPEQNKGIVKP